MRNYSPKLLFLILLSVLFASCNNKVTLVPGCENCDFTCLDKNETDVFTNENKDNWMSVFEVRENSKVDTSFSSGLADGENNFFIMINHTEGDTLIADDEFTNILVFELDKSKESFSLENEELKLIKMYFKRSCYCSDVKFREVNLGCLQGSKQANGTWLVQGKLEVPVFSSTEVLKFDAKFL